MQVHLSETGCPNCHYEDCPASHATFMMTPEKQGPCPNERDAAYTAMARLLDDLRSGRKVVGKARVVNADHSA